MTESIWKKDITTPAFEPLRGDRKTDVLIIGGGLSGILCAYVLRKSGVDCLLVEAERICGGVSSGTTAKISLQHGFIYSSLAERLGLEKARMYLEANRAAGEIYRRICSELDCDYQERDSYIYSLSSKAKPEAEMAALERLGVDAQFCRDLPLPFPIAGAVKISRQAQFHPLKFAYGIAKDLPICENTPVRELAPGIARTGQGTIRAEKIIVATHFPFINKHGSYFIKMYQHRSYVLALKGGGDVGGMYADNDAAGLSFRNWGDYLLLGGGGHKTGKTGGGWRELEEFARRHYPDSRVETRWATQDCMTLDSLPYVGNYSASTPNLFVSTGFNKWGITGSMLGALLLRDMLLGKDKPWAELFSPSRSMLQPQLLLNAAESALNLLTPTRPRCPHLGCALKYNRQEHSWDCPCHGSRFDKNGRLLDNPATGNLKRKTREK